MKTRSPFDRNDLKIKKNDRVLEVGSGNNPSFRADVLVEKFIDTNYHRGGDVKIYPHQTFVHADGENMPFKDKEFDYVISCQVLEHTDDPAKFITEQCRVSRRGYIETPSLIGEYLFPKKSHKWIIIEIDNKLILFEKAKMKGNYALDYGKLFLNYMPYQSIVYRLLWYTRGNIMNVRYEWKDKIDFIVNPKDDYYRSFFVKKWNQKMTEKIFPPQSILQDLFNTLKATCYLFKTLLKNKLIKRNFITMDEYLKYRNINSID